MASVRKLRPNDPSSPWVVEYSDAAGKRRRRTPKSGLKKDADRLRVKIESELAQGEHVPASVTIRMADGIDRFLGECDRRLAMRDLTRGSLRSYVVVSRRLREHFGGYLVTDLSRPVIQAAIDTMARTLAPQTVRYTLALARSVVDHLIYVGVARRNPFRDRFRLPNADEPLRIPTRAQIETLLDAAHRCDPGEHRGATLVRYGALCLALFSTLRRGEIFGLRWGDISLGEGVLHVRHSLSPEDGLKSTKTKAGRRTQVIVPQVAEILRALPGRRRDEDYVFTNIEGRPMNVSSFTTEYWPRICRKAGLVSPEGKTLFRFHDMRHAAASLLIAQGLSVLHVREAMGHADIKTTLGTYGHLFPEDVSRTTASKAIAARFDAT